jgi:hypothetical protein
VGQEMTDEEALIIYNEMEKFFGSLPNFEHEPIQFANCVKLFKYYKQRELNGRSETSIPQQ